MVAMLGMWTIAAGSAMSAANESGESVAFYVAPNGSDDHPGTLQQPFQTISCAQAAVRKSAELRKRPINVYLRGGVYHLGATIRFTPEDSGSANAPISYLPYQNEEVVISGGSRLSLQWKPYRDGILQAETPAGLTMDQFFVNGQRQQMARYPNYSAKGRVIAYRGSAEDAFSPERAKGWSDPVGGYIHAMHEHRWGGYHYRITGKKAGNEITYEGGWQNNRPSEMNKKVRMVENIFEELDAEGEWFHDSKKQTLCFYPPGNVNMETATFDVPRLKHLIEFQGDAKNPVKHISLTGFAFRHTLRTFMETKEPLLRSDWAIYRGGAVRFEGAEDCLIDSCEFDQVGGNAVFASNYNRRITIRGSHIHGAGAGGVCFVGDPDSVRNPLFTYSQRQSYADIDRTPGPKTENYPAECLVADCLIHDIGEVEKQAAGVQISMSKGITIRHCSIYDTSRAGINVSEGTFGGHVIEFCDVFDTVRESADHGSFNSWGRDRYWELKGAPPEQLSELALLDCEKTVIRNSRWSCDHGWDVDLDDGSSNYEIYNNLFLKGGLKLREGFYRRVHNNIAINCSLYVHIWYPDSKDVVTGNIWMGSHQVRTGNWGTGIDRNLFLSEEDRGAFDEHDWDKNSIVGDPMFINPKEGDYRVKEGSPAFKIGFKNFPMDQFGVQNPTLKAMARTPKLPQPGDSTDLQKPKKQQPKAATKEWLGATVAVLVGEEFSAFGVSKEDGGIHLVKVPDDSAAAKAGFQSGDLIQKINSKPVKTVDSLLRLTAKKKPMPVGFVRKQQPMSLTLAP
jgi:hypothetical protein